jgi:hypothetical protein
LLSVARSALHFSANNGAGEAFSASRFLVVPAPSVKDEDSGREIPSPVHSSLVPPQSLMIRGDPALVYARYVSPLERCPWLALPATRVPLYVPQVWSCQREEVALFVCRKLRFALLSCITAVEQWRHGS